MLEDDKSVVLLYRWAVKQLVVVRDTDCCDVEERAKVRGSDD